MQVKHRHGCVNREFNPPGQGTFAVAACVDRGGLAGVIRLWRGYCGQVAPGNNVGTEKFLAPMPEQHQTCRDRVEPAALGNEHG